MNLSELLLSSFPEYTYRGNIFFAYHHLVNMAYMILSANHHSKNVH